MPLSIYNDTDSKKNLAMPLARFCIFLIYSDEDRAPTQFIDVPLTLTLGSKCIKFFLKLIYESSYMKSIAYRVMHLNC